MGRWVLLKHTLPTGRDHYDWLLERPLAHPHLVAPDPERPLISFRIPLLGGRHETRFLAFRVADHRAMYLDYEGEVSGGRGHVLREAWGECEILSDADVFSVRLWGAGGLAVRTDGPPTLWHGRRTGQLIGGFAGDSGVSPKVLAVGDDPPGRIAYTFYLPNEPRFGHTASG